MRSLFNSRGTHCVDLHVPLFFSGIAKTQAVSMAQKQ
jgi:hypothetical protein